MADADAIARLAGELHDQETFTETMEALIASAPAVVGSESAGVILINRKSLSTGPEFDPLAAKADQLQIDLGEGPAHLALAGRPAVLVHDTLEDVRWPQWAGSVAELGIRSALCIRLWVDRVDLGALSFYARTRRAFGSDELAMAEIVGRHASIALASARHQDSLSRAIDARKLVGQAQGILMERYDLDDRRAFDVLRRYSQARNIKLNEVARELVETRELPPV